MAFQKKPAPGWRARDLAKIKKKCKKCGGIYNLAYAEPIIKVMEEKQMCYDCAFENQEPPKIVDDPNICHTLSSYPHEVKNIFE